MAYPDLTNTFHEDAAVGNREDLSDLIYMISPTETPYMMMAGRGTCSGVKHEWQMDALAVAADNAVVQGKKYTAVDAVAPTLRLANYCQISDKAVSVTGTQEVVNKAGRNSELSYQLSKQAKELKRDIEFACVGNTAALGASVIPIAGSTAGRVGSVATQFHTEWTQEYNTALDGANIDRIGAESGGWDASEGLWDAATDGTKRALLESQLKGVIQGAWHNGGDPTIVMAGPFNKTNISEFSGNSTRFDRGEDKRLVASIDVYVSDFGEHRIVPNRFQRERDVFCFTPELNKICYLRPFHQHALAKLGDSEDRVLRAEWTIEHLNNAGNAIVADVTES